MKNVNINVNNGEIKKDSIGNVLKNADHIVVKNKRVEKFGYEEKYAKNYDKICWEKKE